LYYTVYKVTNKLDGKFYIGKHQTKDEVPGWGRRYKVRIIGLHDKEEETIPSDQLPWAQVMYPITAGGGQTNASETPSLRQGNFVFGFFLDGQDQQVPVIMGILGNNSQTALATKIGTTAQNFAATSGYAEGKEPPQQQAKPKVPDTGLGTKKPTTPEQSAECAPAPPGIKINEFGLRSDLSLSKAQFADQQSALQEAEARGLTGVNKASFVQQAVSKGIKDRCKFANSPQSGAAPGATIEQPDNPHVITAGDVKRQEYYTKKIVLMNPCDMPGSALKAIEGDAELGEKPILALMDAVDSFIPQPNRPKDKPFLMPIEDVFSISGRGTVVTGRIEAGVIKTGEEMEIIGIKATQKSVCTGVEMFRKLLDSGEAGDNVGILLRGIERDQVERGQVLAKPGSIKPHTKFEAQAYILKKEEGGRHTPFFTKYRPQFYFRTTDVTGEVLLPAGVEMIMPGDDAKMTVTLITPIAMDNNLKFAIREGGRTVGAGVVTKIIE